MIVSNGFKNWILEFEYDSEPIATKKQLAKIHDQARVEVKAGQKSAWDKFSKEIKTDLNRSLAYLNNLAEQSDNGEAIAETIQTLETTLGPIRKDIYDAVRKALMLSRGEDLNSRNQIKDWLENQNGINHDRYSSKLYNEGPKSAMNVEVVNAVYEGDEEVDGRIILRENFKALFKNDPLVVTFGEDTGKIGGVNQSMEGMQDMFGKQRVMDTGIRECSIIGQGIGMAMRGMRPIAEIQYLDYLLYAIQIMSDDLATVHYRTMGQQIAPLIVRTRGHRLEGILA